MSHVGCVLFYGQIDTSLKRTSVRAASRVTRQQEKEREGRSTCPMGRAATPPSVLVLGTRGLKARHRHLMRDVLRLLPHGVPGSKLDVEDNQLKGVNGACEDANCSSALLFDARDEKRLFLWVASCPDGPSAMFRLRNAHTVSELNLEPRRCAGVRNLLAFDQSFEASAERRVLKALLSRVLSVPRGAAQRVAAAGAAAAAAAEEADVGDGDEAASDGDGDGDGDGDAEPQLKRQRRPQTPTVERVKHTFTFSWVDGRIWLRVYRIGPDPSTGTMEVEEIGPRLVLEPVRIIAGAFGGAVLHSHTSTAQNELADEDEMQ